MIQIKKFVLGWTFILFFSNCMANNIPASKEYVDQLFTAFQKEIDALTPIYSVGSCYGGGVIFYVNPNPNAAAGQRGLIAALDDLPDTDGYGWANNSYSTVIGTSNFLFQGLTNSTIILATTGTFPAAQAATDYVTLQNCTTCTSWYLPSVGELNTLILQQNLYDLSNYCGATNLSSDSGYWTSSGTYSDDSGKSIAYFVGQADAVVSLAPISFQNPVRPIRAF